MKEKLNKYTSLELSKKLAENGCKLKNEYWWHDVPNCPINIIANPVIYLGKKDDWYSTNKDNQKIIEQYQYPAYDILNDICVKYKDYFWGAKQYKTLKVLELLQQNKKQEAEDYIWKNCLFNKKGKK